MNRFSAKKKSLTKSTAGSLQFYESQINDNIEICPKVYLYKCLHDEDACKFFCKYQHIDPALCLFYTQGKCYNSAETCSRLHSDLAQSLYKKIKIKEINKASKPKSSQQLQTEQEPSEQSEVIFEEEKHIGPTEQSKEVPMKLEQNVQLESIKNENLGLTEQDQELINDYLDFLETNNCNCDQDNQDDLSVKLGTSLIDPEELIMEQLDVFVPPEITDEIRSLNSSQFNEFFTEACNMQKKIREISDDTPFNLQFNVDPKMNTIELEIHNYHYNN